MGMLGPVDLYANCAAQSLLQNQMLAQQQMGLMNALAQQQTQYIDYGLSVFQPSWEPSSKKVVEDRIEQASAGCVEAGERIIERIAFWREWPVIGERIASRLADELDVISESLERAHG